MTQQPYAPPQYPPAPPQQYAPQYPQVPQQPYPAAPPQQYAAPAYGPPQPPAQPLATGSLDDYYSQPSVGGGPSLSWTDKQGTPKPIGTTYAGIVVRDVTNADVQQQTDFKTQAPLFYRDGRPKFAMKVPLRVQQSEEYPEGEAAWYVKGQARDELVRAMSEKGCEGAPKAGALIVVRLVQRRPSGPGMNPANIVQVEYTPPPAGTGAPSPAPVPQQVAAPQPPAPQAPPVQYEQPVQQPQYAAPPVQQQVPVQVQAPQAPAPQPPANLSPEQQQLLAQLTGGAPAPQPAGQ